MTETGLITKCTVTGYTNGLTADVMRENISMIINTEKACIYTLTGASTMVNGKMEDSMDKESILPPLVSIEWEFGMQAKGRNGLIKYKMIQRDEV